MNWPQIKKKKNHHFEVLSSVILCKSNRPFLDCIVIYDEKWILYHNWQWPAQWLDREEAPKHFPKPNLHQKRTWSLFDGLLPIWSITAFWVPVKTLHLRRMLSKSMRCTENCNACNKALVNRKGPILYDNAQPHVAQPMLQKWSKLAYKVLSHLPYLPNLSPADYHFFKQHFAGKILPQAVRGRKCFREFIKSTGINKFIPHWQKCVDCTGSYLI